MTLAHDGVFPTTLDLKNCVEIPQTCRVKRIAGAPLLFFSSKEKLISNLWRPQENHGRYLGKSIGKKKAEKNGAPRNEKTRAM